MSASPNLRLPYLDANQNQKSVTHNAALRMLDALVNAEIQSSVLTAPPAAPGDGQCWIVGSGATGAWAGKDLDIAAWQDGAWAFYAPGRGMLAFDAAAAAPVLWTGAAWVPLFGLIAQLGLKALGIGTAADAANPLSATLNNALFNALGAAAGGTGDVRVKLNKASAGNTASFLFQDGFSGRAEIGLAGDDSLHFKVSADGASFVDALVLDPALKGPRVPSLNGGPLAGHRNRVINGNFAVNQRAQASGTALAAGAYGHDRWKAGSGGCTYTFAPGTPDTTVTVTAGTLVQAVEPVNVEGGSYTLSWTGTATARIYAGSAAGAYAASPLSITGVAADTDLAVEFATGTLGQVQLEAGPAATPFERRFLTVETALCMRYYQFFPASTGGWGPNATVFNYCTTYPVPMRAAPTVAFLSSGTGVTIPFVANYAATGIYYSYCLADTGLMALTTATAQNGAIGLPQSDLKISMNAEL